MKIDVQEGQRVERVSDNTTARTVLVIAGLVFVLSVLLGVGGALASANAPDWPPAAGSAERSPTDPPTVAGDAWASSALTPSALYDIIFPLQTRFPFEDDFLAPRASGPHNANDIMAPFMTPILAVTDGTLDWMNFTGKLSSYNNLPYYNILLHGVDGNDYLYIHLNNDTPGTDDGHGDTQYAYAAGLTNGSTVHRGDLIGYVGNSGNAEDVDPHLDFSIHPGGYKNPPKPVDPYQSLKAALTWDEWQAAHGGGTPKEVPFGDVNTGDWFYPDLVQLFKAGVVQGAADLTFKPYLDISRAQFAALLVRAFAPDQLRDFPGATTTTTTLAPTTTTSTAPLTATAVTTTTKRTTTTVHATTTSTTLGPTTTTTRPPGAPRFIDVPKTYWAYPEVTIAEHLKLVEGVGDGSRFSPDAPITRAQMATMIARALPVLGLGAAPTAAPEVRVFVDVPVDHWAVAAIARMRELELMVGDADGRFKPEDRTQRAQATAVIARTLRLRDAGGGS
jgi:murein DD-endopeptidase MepM/ murein hydrolase activator NlpD